MSIIENPVYFLFYILLGTRVSVWLFASLFPFPSFPLSLPAPFSIISLQSILTLIFTQYCLLPFTSNVTHVHRSSSPAPKVTFQLMSDPTYTPAKATSGRPSNLSIGLVVLILILTVSQPVTPNPSRTQQQPHRHVAAHTHTHTHTHTHIYIYIYIP